VVSKQLANVHSSLQGLQQLRSLDLTACKMMADVAGRLTQLVQLTHLKLDVEQWSADGTLAVPALRPLTNLLELQLSPPPVQPAAEAGAEAAGPYGLPSSLTHLSINCRWRCQAATVADWVTHLPGCPQLRQLEIHYTHVVDGVNPTTLVSNLQQHNRQLRSLSLRYQPGEAPMAALPLEVVRQALPGLECLQAPYLLSISDQDDWQHLAAWRGLTQLGAGIMCVPVLPVGTSVGVLELVDCRVHLDGYGLGQVLLGLRSLQRATVALRSPAPQPVQPSRPQLAPHASLKVFGLTCFAGPPGMGTAAAECSALAPVLRGVANLSMAWPELFNTLPDLSQCTALSALSFRTLTVAAEYTKDEYVSMLAPLVQLRSLELYNAGQLSAEAAVQLQHMLPKLQHMSMSHCGSLVRQPVIECGMRELQALPEHGAEMQAFQQVKQQLRPDLRLRVSMEYRDTSVHDRFVVVKRMLQA
jgi:hypothetical protein